MAKIEIAPINRVAVTLLLICIMAGLITGSLMEHPVPIIVGGLLGLYLLFAIKVV